LFPLDLFLQKKKKKDITYNTTTSTECWMFKNPTPWTDYKNLWKRFSRAFDFLDNNFKEGCCGFFYEEIK
jgi:hypothetical protein